MAKILHKLEFVLIKCTPYPALMGEVWDVCCEDFQENWQRYNGTTLYLGANELKTIFPPQISTVKSLLPQNVIYCFACGNWLFYAFFIAAELFLKFHMI